MITVILDVDLHTVSCFCALQHNTFSLYSSNVPNDNYIFYFIILIQRIRIRNNINIYTIVQFIPKHLHNILPRVAKRPLLELLQNDAHYLLSSLHHVCK